MKSLFAGILAAGAFSASFAASVETQDKDALTPVRQIVVQPTKNVIEPIVYDVFGEQLRILKQDEADRLVIVSKPDNECPPCAKQHKVVTQLAKDGYNVQVILLAEYTGKENVTGTPTLFYYNGDKLVAKNKGYQTYAQVTKTLRKPTVELSQND